MTIRAEMFSNILSREYNIPLDQILPFFENEFQLCLVGKADIKKELKKYLKKWKLNKTPSELLNDWFKFEDKIDKRILLIIKKLQQKKILCVLATNQEQYRTKYLLEKMHLDSIFDKVYSSAHIGFRKPNKDFYNYIYQDLKKQEIYYWDDRGKNILSARKFGFKAKRYTNLKDFKNVINDFL